MTTETSHKLTKSAVKTEDSGRRRGLSRSASKNLAFYVFISPWLIGFVALTLLPLIGGLILSFTNYDGLNWIPFSDSPMNTVKFTGISNYERIFSDRDALFTLRQVFLWTLLNTPLWLVISFVLAYLLNQRIRGRGFFRTVFYLPSVVPVVAIATIGSQLYHSQFGLVNQSVRVLFPGFSINWLTEYALFSVTSIAVWTGIGSGMIIFLAGLQGIPAVYEEAAIIDGASKYQRFRFITIPLMTPLIFYQLILSMVTALQYYALPLLMAPDANNTAGLLSRQPTRDIFLYMIHALRQAFTFQRFGYSLALTWFLVLIIVVFTVILFKSSSFWVYYENE